MPGLKMDIAIPSLDDLRSEMKSLANADDAVFLQRFFKTGPGEYGEDDRFLGIRVPEVRRMARKYHGLSRSDTVELLRSPWHEERLLALVLLVDAFSRVDEPGREEIYRLYMANTAFINNWDLVDASAEHVVGGYLATRGDVQPLRELARSDSLWERRIGMMATFHFTRRGHCAPALEIAELLVGDGHDLIHKAVGWMLREVSKRDMAAEEAFLRRHLRDMPRTMLRYAIERFPEPLRKSYLAGDITADCHRAVDDPHRAP